MVWPSLVTPGQRILASDFNSIITTFSTWADSVNSVLTVQGGAPTFNAGATFSAIATFTAGATFSTVAPTFPAGASFGPGAVTFSSSPTLAGATFSAIAIHNAGASFQGGSVSFAANAPATFGGAVTFTVAPTFTDAAGTRTALGLPAPSTIPTLAGSNVFSSTGANLQTIAATAAGAAVFAGIYLQNDLGAFCSMRNYSSTATTVLGGITLANWSVLYANSGNGLLIETANAAPIVFGVNNAERFRFASDGTATWLAPTTFSSSASVTFNGSVSVTTPISTSGGVITMTRPAAYLNSGASWALNIQTSSASDNLSFGQTGANYTTSGVLGWVGNSNAFLYFNSGQDFRIGAGVGATPFICVKGTGRVLMGSATDDGVNLLQVNGTTKTSGLNVANASAVTMGSDWTAFTPTVQSVAGAMTVTISTNSDFSYYLIGKLCFVKFNLIVTIGGTPNAWFNLWMPFSSAAPGGVSSGHVLLSTNGTNWVNGYMYAGGSVFTVAQEQYATLAAGQLYVQGEFFYQTT